MERQRVVHAHGVRRGWVRRRIILTGDLRAVVEYDGAELGHEALWVDGVIASRLSGPSWYSWYAPRFEFELATPSGPLPAVLEVEIAFNIKALRLTLAETVVYAEGRFGSVGSSGTPLILPIPATSRLEYEALPFPPSPMPWIRPGYR